MWKEKEEVENEDKEDKDEGLPLLIMFSLWKHVFVWNNFFRFVCFCGLCALKTKKPPRGLAIFFFNSRNFSILEKIKFQDSAKSKTLETELDSHSKSTIWKNDNIHIIVSPGELYNFKNIRWLYSNLLNILLLYNV